MNRRNIYMDEKIIDLNDSELYSGKSKCSPVVSDVGGEYYKVSYHIANGKPNGNYANLEDLSVASKLMQINEVHNIMLPEYFKETDEISGAEEKRLIRGTAFEGYKLKPLKWKYPIMCMTKGELDTEERLYAKEVSKEALERAEKVGKKVNMLSGKGRIDAVSNSVIASNFDNARVTTIADIVNESSLSFTGKDSLDCRWLNECRIRSKDESELELKIKFAAGCEFIGGNLVTMGKCIFAECTFMDCNIRIDRPTHFHACTFMSCSITAKNEDISMIVCSLVNTDKKDIKLT